MSVIFNYRNILVIQTAFIGDAILASSLLEKLHHHFPEASVSILVRKGNESIYTGHPFLKEVLVWNKQTEKIKNLFKLLFQIRRNNYDLVINCHRFASSGLLTSFSGAHHKAGYKQTPFSYLLDHAPKHTFGDGKHEVERYNQLIEDFTGKEFFLPKIYPTQADIEKVKLLQNTNYICIAPSSVWFTKQLPIEKWIELCDQTSENSTIFILGAPSDKKLAEEIIQLSKHKNISSLCGELSLLQSAALMQKAKMNYVNDSAPLHLASATNSPVTAFFCSTVKEFGFYPLSEYTKIVDAGKMECRPCGMHGHKQCPKGHFNCGKNISIKEALS
ncbi:MAG: glycosyltransferase family 9 protein [Sphingobacteriaceae bacterium]